MLDAKIASALTIPEEGQSRGTESPEGGPVSTRKTDRLHDLRILSSNGCACCCIKLGWFCSLSLFMTIIFGNSKQRWDEVLLSVSKIPSDVVLEGLYKLRIRESAQLKNCIGIVRHGDSSEDIDTRLSKNEDNGEKEFRSETSITKL